MPTHRSREERDMHLRLLGLLHAVENFADTLRRVLKLPPHVIPVTGRHPLTLPRWRVLGKGEALKTLGRSGMVPPRSWRHTKRSGKKGRH